MAGPAERRDQPGNEPNAGFAAPAGAQFSQYPYPIDSELTMSANYAVPHFEAATSIEPAAHAQMNTLSMDANGASPAAGPVDATMAPPQTPGQPAIIPAGQRTSVDALSDNGQTPQTGEKRKRVKASRACDECRRKKIRCDSPTDPGGVPKTCNNCQKAGVTCEYERKPMKRGPSKGYIKELAERVQHMENVQEKALRQSLDGNHNLAGYAETFSQEEPTNTAGFRRNISFSANTPFASSEFHRERIPSTGTWTTKPSAASGSRTRDRGSVAIAPNETVPSAAASRDQEPSKIDLTDSPWTEIDESRAAKRPRLESRFENLEATTMDPTWLNKYYQQVHPVFALLPDADIVAGVINKAHPSLQHAFITAIELLPDFEAKIAVNGTHDTTSPDHVTDGPKASFKSDVFINYDDMIVVLGHLLAQSPKTRSEENNLALLWTIILLSVECENDVQLLDTEGYSKSTLLLSTNSLVVYLRTQEASTPTTAHIQDRALFREVVHKARNCATFLIQLHCLSIALMPEELAGDDMFSVELTETWNSPPEAAFLAHGSIVMASVVALLLEETEQSAKTSLRVMRRGHRPFLRTIISFHRRLKRNQPIVQQFECLFELIFSRQIPLEGEPAHIFAAACTLADVLVEDPEALSETPRFNPLDIHTYSLAAITLCEFVRDVSDEEMRVEATKCLDMLRVPLEKKSQLFHKNFAYSWFYAESDTDPNTYKMCHWSDCLLNMIDDVKGKVAAGQVTTNDDPDRITAPKFAKILRRGWLRILLHYRTN